MDKSKKCCKSLIKRLAAMALALAMVLTYMPVLAFAEGEDAEADQQAIENAEEAVEEVLAEEAPLAASEGIKAIKFIPADDFPIEVTEGDYWFDYAYEGNAFEVTYSTGTKKYISIEVEEVDEEDGEVYTTYRFYENGDKTKEALDDIEYKINGSADGEFKAGKNTVSFYIDEESGVSCDYIVTAAAKVIELTFIHVSGFEITADEGGSWPSFYAVGNKFIVTYSDGKREEYICQTYNINNAEGYVDYDYFEKTTKERLVDVYPVINGEEDGTFRLGNDNTVAFRIGDAYTKEFPVRVDPAPAALEFIPAPGVTLWAFEGVYNIDDNAYYAEGNKFIVTYTDGSKKTYVCEEEPIKKSGKTEYYVGYFEEGKSHTDANGAFLDMDFYYDHDIPDGGFAIGNNPVRFHINGVDENVFSKPFNVIGKPDATGVVFSPSSIDAVIYDQYDDIDWFKSGNKIVVTYSDKTKKTFVPGEVRDSDGLTYTAFKNGDEVVDWDWNEARLKEGKNTIKLTFWNVSSEDDLTCNVTINATRYGVCKTHKLVKIGAVKATCQSPGVKAHYECTVCHKIFSDSKGKKETTFAKLQTKKAKHVYKKKIQTEEYLKSAANCTKKATYYYACSMCDTKGTKTYTVGKPLGHDFVPGSITKATAKKDGKIASKCSRCGKTNKGTKIPKASKIVVLNKKSITYMGNGEEKDAIEVVVKSSKYPLGADEYTVTKSEPTYNFKKKNGSGTITVTFTPECKYYSGSMTLTYKITKVPKVAN